MAVKPTDLGTVIVEAVEVLRRHRVRYFIAGYSAATYWLGRKAYRATFDADISVFAADLPPVLVELGRRGWQATPLRGASIKASHPSHIFRLDFFLFGRRLIGPRGSYNADWLVKDAWKHAVYKTVKGRKVRFARPEHVLLLKAVSILLGYDGKHPDDIRRILLLSDVDTELMYRQAKRMGLWPILAAVAECREPPVISPAGFAAA